MEAKKHALNNQQITEEIKKEIKISIETNENENTKTQNLWDTLFFFYFIFKFYIIVLVLPNIKMNLPQAYMCSPS